MTEDAFQPGDNFPFRRKTGAGYSAFHPQRCGYCAGGQSTEDDGRRMSQSPNPASGAEESSVVGGLGISAPLPPLSHHINTRRGSAVRAIDVRIAEGSQVRFTSAAVESTLHHTLP